MVQSVRPDASTPLADVVGKRTAGAFARGLGVETVGDLLEHLPRRYLHHGDLTDIGHLPVGEAVTVVADIVDVVRRPMRKRRGTLLEVTVTDGTGTLRLTFFNAHIDPSRLTPGARGIFSGQVSVYQGHLQLTHPEFETFDEAVAGSNGGGEDWATRPVPVYPATAAVSSRRIRRVIARVLDAHPVIPDVWDDRIARERKLLSTARAYELVHRPRGDSDPLAGLATLRFREAFILQTALLVKRAENEREPATARVPAPTGLLQRFDSALPWPLTAGQTRVGESIVADLARDRPMNRLLQGEVGSGKTVVALRAMLVVADSGGQSALLAPTEVLARQHYASIVSMLGPDLAALVHPVLITGGQSAAERGRSALAAAAGQARIIVGTHALLSDSTAFFDLGLVVVDEQHRFGVEQRESLRRKSPRSPHVLMLTATPIPRTVAMTVFGDLDISSLRELPAGRQPIASFVVPTAEKPAWAHRVWARLAEEAAAGRQGYVVCGLIDADPKGERSSVEETVRELHDNPDTAGLRVVALTGRMPSAEKESTMAEFESGAADVLVATTVVEVGVNVPNATIMVVRNAERFGISQLHQLRGRVGRGVHPGLALFLTDAPSGSLARRRLDAVASTSDGFLLADADLELRDEGDVLGSAQSGHRSSLRLLRVARDAALIASARDEARRVLAVDPGLSAHSALAHALRRELPDDASDYLVSS